MFSDKSLQELVLQKPQTLAALRKIYGLGELKVARYGEQLLQILQQGLAAE